MTPQAILAHYDSGESWPAGHGVPADGDLDRAYATALAVRALREARGERVAGYKIGWTNRANWARQGVAAPMWGTLHETTIVRADPGGGSPAPAVDLARLPLPRIEPEVVVGLHATPPDDPDLDQLFDCLEWLAPGFEIVQSHLPDWAYAPAQTIADGGVHARLVVGRPSPVRALAADGATLAALLARARVRVSEGGTPRGEGIGADVLGGPLEALRHFVRGMARCPGATRLRPGDVVTTGAWTPSFPIAPGQAWRAEFEGVPVPALAVVLR